MKSLIIEGCRQASEMYPNMDCTVYTDFLDEQYGGRGDVLVLKSKGKLTDFLYIPINMNCNEISKSEIFHSVWVWGDLVFDIKYNNIGVPLEEYLELCNKLTVSGVRADATQSSYTFGLPTNRNK